MKGVVRNGDNLASRRMLVSGSVPKGERATGGGRGGGGGEGGKRGGEGRGKSSGGGGLRRDIRGERTGIRVRGKYHR